MRLSICILIFIFCVETLSARVADTIVEAPVILELEEINRVVIKPYESGELPVSIASANAPTLTLETFFMIEAPKITENFELIDILPSYMKRRFNMDFRELYDVKGRIVTEKYIMLTARVYNHSKDANVAFDGENIKVVTDFLYVSQYAFLYIIQDSGEYKIFYTLEGPMYNIADGNHYDTVWSLHSAVSEKKELAEAVLGYYLKETGLSKAGFKQVKMKRKVVRQLFSPNVH